jgi:glycosyltransferase involved in cell wall biosynthesis
MKHVLIVTHIPFWRHSSGDKARILSLVVYLSQHTRLIVACAGQAESNDLECIAALGRNINVVFLGKEKELTRERYTDLFAEFMASRHFDTCIFEYAFLSFLIPLIPAGTRIMLDTHEVVSLGIPERNRKGYGGPSDEITWEQELRLYDLYDKVLLIQADEYQKVMEALGREKVLLVPHPPRFCKRDLRSQVRIIGYVASEYGPNIDSINWYLRNVWPLLSGEDWLLSIYGNIGPRLNTNGLRNVHIRGFVPDLNAIYEEADLIINPILYGAGLKIKNVEAMANGLPLITTSHGAAGIGEGAGEAFLAADNPAEFAACIRHLSGDVSRRQEMGNKAFELAKARFSAEVCFGPLLSEINANKEAARTRFAPRT